jgi:hypothetical protein
MRLDLWFRVFLRRAPHFAFCAFGCGLLFELWSFLFLLLFSCHMFFLYLFILVHNKNERFFQCCSDIKFIKYQPGVGIKIHFILRYQASTVILVFFELSPVWSWYGVHNWFLASMQQVYTWYWDLYKSDTRLSFSQLILNWSFPCYQCWFRCRLPNQHWFFFIFNLIDDWGWLYICFKFRNNLPFVNNWWMELRKLGNKVRNVLTLSLCGMLINGFGDESFCPMVKAFPSHNC